LSVVFMARDAFFHQSARFRSTQALSRPELTYRWRVILTALFGLVHGLGFASVLDGLGVSASDTLTALAFFNIGVELGQIAFVLTVLAIIWLLRRVHIERLMVPAATCVVGAMGVFWTLERVMFGA